MLPTSRINQSSAFNSPVLIAHKLLRAISDCPGKITLGKNLLKPTNSTLASVSRSLILQLAKNKITHQNQKNMQEYLYDFHTQSWERYQHRIVNRIWRNATEEKLVRMQERYHREWAAHLMPDYIINEIFSPVKKLKA